MIVPVYNTEKYLDECIQSILNQSFTDFELLLIDDGSTDRSGEICDQYVTKDERVRVFHKENGGVSSARNMGLDEARGEWIAFVDSDDWVFPEWLQTFGELRKDVDLVVQGFETSGPLWDDKNCDLYHKRKHGFNYAGSTLEGMILLDSNAMQGYLWCKCFKRDVIERLSLRFDTRYNIWEDEEFCLRYFMHCNNMISTSKIGYFYFVPQWGKKYSDKNHLFELYQSMYQSVYEIFKGRINKITEHYLEKYIAELLWSYKRNDVDSKHKLIQFRRVVGKSILSTHLFFLTKWLIYLDRTNYFSNILLRIHVCLKHSC